MRWLTFSVVLVLLSLGVAGDAAAQDGEDDRVVRISPAGEAYIDPEILPGGALLTYQSNGNIYLAALDPATGLFRSGEGKDILIDSGAARPIETFNGPEFGIDRDGWALYYAKPHEGEVQIWRATLNPDGTAETTPITSGDRYQTQLVSRNSRGETVRMAAIQGTWQDGTAVWLDESDPMTVYDISPIEVGVNPVRWIDGSYLMTSSERTGPNRGQVTLLDTNTNTKTLITTDAGDKTDPYGWFAPEFGNDLLVLAIVDNSAVAVYRDTGGEAWERILTLTPPPGSQYDFVASAEPFVVGGRSYMSLIIKNAGDNREQFTDSEVWLFNLDDDPTTRYAERCDSGEAGLSRSDPEAFIGDEQVYIYYNVIGGPGVTPYETRRCRSIIPTDGSMPQIMPPVAQDPPVIQDPPADAAAVCQWVAPDATDPAVDTALEPHYVCRDETAAPRDALLVFFPGTGATPADYELFVQQAASMGLHAVSLRYPNDLSVNLHHCPGDPDPNCHANVRREVLYGGDLHPDVTISDANTISNRLVALLRYLDAQDPAAGWGQYLVGDAPAWERIVVAGHSQGAGMAGMVAHDNLVLRAVLFGWVDQSRGQPALWITEPNATPGERIYTFEHVEDRTRGEAAKQVMFEAFGLNPENEVNVDTMAPPYNNAHVLLTSVTPAIQGDRPSAATHNVVVGDDYVPIVDGVPVLADAWAYLLDVMP